MEVPAFESTQPGSGAQAFTLTEPLWKQNRTRSGYAMAQASEFGAVDPGVAERPPRGFLIFKKIGGIFFF